MIDQASIKREGVSRARWLMLAILSLDICVSYIPYYTFVPVLRQSMQVFNVDEPALNMLCIMYALVYVPGAFVTSPVLGVLGCRWTYIVAMSCISLGCAIRCGPAFITSFTSAPSNNQESTAPASFRWLLLGQTLCAFGQPFLVNTTSEMGAEWFPPSERPTAAMLSNLMNFIGGSVSFMIPPCLVEDHSELLDVTEAQMQAMLQFEFWIVFVSLVITLILYKPAPVVSLCAPRALVPLYKEVLRLFCVRDFWLVNGYFSIFVALCHAFDAVEGSLLEHYGYSAALSSWTGVACCITAILSTLLESRFISHPSSYKRALFVASAFLAASQLIAFLALQFQMDGAVFIFAVGVMGLSTPGWGCSCELGSEVCFPAREATVSSVLEAFSNLMGVLTIIVVQYLLDVGFGSHVLVLMAFMATLGGFLLLGMHGTLLRHEAEMTLSTPDEEEQEEIAVLKSSLSVSLSTVLRRCPTSSIATGFVGVVVLYTAFSIIPQTRQPDLMEESMSEIHAENSSSPVLSLIPGEVAPWVPEPRGEHNASDILAHGLFEPRIYVINCEEDKRRLHRFAKSMKRAGLNFTIARCVQGTPSEVNASIYANLLPSSATTATEGATWQGLERSALIGKAMAHLWLWKTIVDANVQIANIFEDDEVVHKDFRAKRDVLLRQLPAEVDFVKLNTFQPVGKRFSPPGKRNGWMLRHVFKMNPRLSAFTNLWMSNYVVTRQGAEKLLAFGQSYDTFGAGAIFDMHITSQIYDGIRNGEFVGFAVGTNVISHHCENHGLCYRVKRSGNNSDRGRVRECNKTKTIKICNE